MYIYIYIFIHNITLLALLSLWYLNKFTRRLCNWTVHSVLLWAMAPQISLDCIVYCIVFEPYLHYSGIQNLRIQPRIKYLTPTLVIFVTRQSIQYNTIQYRLIYGAMAHNSTKYTVRIQRRRVNLLRYQRLRRAEKRQWYYDIT